MTETILIIEDNDNTNLQNLIKKYPDCKIYCLSYFSHRNLSKNNIAHEVGESLLSEDDKKLIDQKTHYLTINWYNQDKIKDLLTFDGINLGSLIELDLLHYFLTLYRNAVTLLKIIDTEKPKKVITLSYLNTFVKKICEKKSIEYNAIKFIEQPSLYADKINIKFNLGTFPISFNVSRGNFNKIKKFVKKLSELFILNSKPDFTQKSILLVDFNPVMYDDLLLELSKLDKNILLLNQRRPAIWNLQSLKIVKNTHCKIIELDTFQKYVDQNKSDKLNILSKNLNTMWKQNIIFDEMFKIDSISLWASIRESFVKMCTIRFKESARRILLLNEFFERSNISLILEWAETGQEEKELLNVAKKYPIPKLMLQHNLFPLSKTWNNYDRFMIGFSHTFLSDKQVIWDNLTKSHALSLGIKNENLVLTGSPKHDKFFNYSHPKTTKNIIVLATTAPSNTSIEMTPFDAYVKFENFIREVCRICKQIPDIQLIIKPHPLADYYTNTTALIREIDPNIPIIYDANLVELIGSCKLLITFNNSTIALESIILNKPTISLQFEKWTEEDNIVKTNALMSISEVSEVENGIKKFLYDKDVQNTYQNNRITFLDEFVNKGSASKELAKVLDTL